MKLLHSSTLIFLFSIFFFSESYAQPTPIYSCNGAGTDLYLVNLMNPSAVDIDDGTVDGNCEYSLELSTTNSPFTFVTFTYVGSGTANPASVDIAGATNGFITISSACNDLDIEFDITTQLGVAICQIRNAYMPVELTQFEAKAMKGGVLLNWETASEINNLGFDVERSTNGKFWKKLNFVEGHLTTLKTQRYEFVDQQPYEGQSYYRLKQIDLDGAFEYSKIVATSYNRDKSGLTIFPNPAHDELTLSFTHELEYTEAEVSIFNNLGQLVRQELIHSNSLKVNELSDGFYLLVVRLDNQIYSVRFIKR